MKICRAPTKFSINPVSLNCCNFVPSKKNKMQDFSILTLPALLQRSVKKYGKRPAVAFVDETPLSYAEFDKQRLSVISLLEKLKIQAGDRVALLSTNMPNWGITYFAIVSMGAIVVPILPDFSENEIFYFGGMRRQFK